MGTIVYNGAIISGNFSKLSKRKPKNWIEKDYKILISYPFKWREKIGKVECTCKQCEEHHQPWYGMTWYHSNECALIQLINNRPQLMNLFCYSHLPFLASTE